MGGPEASRVVQDVFMELKTATDDLRVPRDRFGPIFTYYYPGRWLTIAARSLRLSPMPDYRLYSGELGEMAASARVVVERANKAVARLREVPGASVQEPLKRALQGTHNQINYDANVIILFNEHNRAMDVGPPEYASQCFVAMMDFAKRARINLKEQENVTDAVRQLQGDF